MNKMTTTQQQPRQEARRFRLTDRDYAILKALNRYRYLRTGQVQRLFFQECHSVQMARRRLRNLSDPHYGYIQRIEPYIQIGHGSAETAWYLGRAGEEILRARGARLRRTPGGNSGRVKHEFLAHALAISEFRLLLELALQDVPAVDIERTIFDFELKERATKQVGVKAHVLFDEVFAPVGHEDETVSRYVVRPDLLVLLRAASARQTHRQLYFIEIDRGTENLRRIRRKVIGYGLFLRQKRHQRFAPTEGFKVLIQTTSARRAKNVIAEIARLKDEKTKKLVLVTSENEVTTETILTSDIWMTAAGQPKTLLKAPRIRQKPPGEVENAEPENPHQAASCTR
jgi:hypothetical protein